MKKLLIIGILIFGTINVNAQILSIEAEGNLESPNPIGCILLSKVSKNNNPADILKGMAKCIELKEFQKAVRLFAIAGVYGTYDTYRVKDKSAHQALLVLQQNVFLNFSKKQTNSFLKNLKKELELNSDSLIEICSTIQDIGIPEYQPTYMIQHGISAFTENNGNGLVEEFDSNESWNTALRTYLRCGK